MITLYWFPRTRATRTLWLLEELGEPFEMQMIDLRSESSRADPGFRAASPMGKVPAIRDGEAAMAESAAIAIYLADRYPAAGLAPAIDAPDRGKYLYWTSYTPAVIEPAMMERFNQWKVNPQSSGWGNFDLMIATLEKGLAEGPWILGDRFSAADTLLGSSVNFIKLFGIMPESPVLEAYLERCLARPAFQSAINRTADAPDDD